MLLAVPLSAQYPGQAKASRMRAVGLSKNAAHFNGVKVGNTMLTAALVSGGIIYQ